jgi:hypothetical protein
VIRSLAVEPRPVHETFRGDVLTLFFAPDADDALAVWRVRWSRASEAARAVEMVAASLGDHGVAAWRIETDGSRDMAIAASTRQGVPGLLQQQLEWEALPDKEDVPEVAVSGILRRCSTR